MMKLAFAICTILCTLELTQSAVVQTDGLVPLLDARRAVTRYWVSTFSTTWVNAEKYCRSSGRRLVSIDDDVEQNELHAYLALNGYGGGPYYWISLNDITSEGDFYWFSTGEQLLWPNWAPSSSNPNGPSDPTTAGNNAANDCCTINTDALWKYKWMVNPCGLSKPFICEAL